MARAMKKTIILHIGHFKTGTTALQVFMAQNAERFREAGLHYAESHLKNAKQSALAFSLFHAVGVRELMHGYDDDTPPETLWRKFFDEARRRPEPAVLASSEEFMRLGAWPEAADRLHRIIISAAGEFDFRVIAYLRPPQAHLRSWYNQLVKMRQKIGDFDSAVQVGMEPVHLDYALALRPFFEMFGARAVTLRLFDDALREENRLFIDFLAALGLPAPPAGLVWPQNDPNPRLDDRLLEIVRIAQNAGLPGPAVRALAERASAHFDAEAARLPTVAAGFEAVAEQTRRGIETLAAIKGEEFDTAPLLAALPRPQASDSQQPGELLGFLLEEYARMQHRQRKKFSDHSARIEALEARLAALDNGKTD